MTKHGLSNTRLYRIYCGMKQRCYNPNVPQYKRYGGRGIDICDKWLGPTGFIHFYFWAISHGYEEELTIDHIDADAGYSPANCQWLTLSDNASRAHRGTGYKRPMYLSSNHRNYSAYACELISHGWRIKCTTALHGIFVRANFRITLPLYQEPSKYIQDALSTMYQQAQ